MLLKENGSWVGAGGKVSDAFIIRLNNFFTSATMLFTRRDDGPKMPAGTLKTGEFGMIHASIFRALEVCPR